MMEFIKPPNINAPTTQGQVNQLKDYLYQLSQQLNFIVSTLNNKEESK